MARRSRRLCEGSAGLGALQKAYRDRKQLSASLQAETHISSHATEREQLQFDTYVWRPVKLQLKRPIDFKKIIEKKKIIPSWKHHRPKWAFKSLTCGLAGAKAPVGEGTTHRHPVFA